MKLPLLWAAVLSANPTWAELKPDEIAIIAMRRSPRSCELADYYASRRGIPRSHICLLNGRPTIVLSRADWESSTRPAIRRWLVENHLEEKIRCLVTTWDVPLKIDRRDARVPSVLERLIYLASERRNRLDQTLSLTAELDAVRPASDPPQPVDEVVSPSSKPEPTREEIASRFDAAFKAAYARVEAVRDDPAAKQLAPMLEKSLFTGRGLTGLLRSAAYQTDLSKIEPDIAKRIQVATGEVQGLKYGFEALQRLPDSVERDQQILEVVQRASGLLGALAWIEEQQAALEKNETYASFDSELSLLYWPSYPLLRWQPNVLHYAYDGSSAQQMQLTLMVSRLEAPTFELAKKLVDSAIATEQVGLSGKVYLDARGLAFDSRKGSYGDYDQSLRNLDRLLKQHTKLEVVLDNRDRLFQPGDCPDTALYCGWYALAKYVDAFDWRPGAVGYHMASGEADTLRDPNSNVWCKRMLEKGVCATLGPVYEPYLSAFPRPEDFFGLLLTGRYTLVESYYRTNPFNSWVMVLVGDPLYNPYRHNPQLDVASLPRQLLGSEPRTGKPLETSEQP